MAVQIADRLGTERSSNFSGSGSCYQSRHRPVPLVVFRHRRGGSAVDDDRRSYAIGPRHFKLLDQWNEVSTKQRGQAFRKRLARGRNFFLAELEKPHPNLRDSWYPWLLAFGLGRQVDVWSSHHSSTTASSSTSSSTWDHTTSRSSSSPSSTDTGWSGGGGLSGGAGASGAWAAAAAGMAAGVAAPSSSSSGSSGSSSSSSGGSSGGGGGGW